LKGALTINGVERFAKKSACITSTNVGRENQTFGHGKEPKKDKVNYEI
jgi:hypothetical protein